MEKKETQKHTFKIGKALFLLLIPCIVLGLIFTGYFTFRRTISRFTLDFYYPYLNAIHTVENNAAAESLQLAPKNKLVNMVSILMKQNAILNGIAEQVHNLTEENNQLRAMLKLDHYKTFRGISAEIVSRNPMTWNEQFVISRGSNFGIAPGDAVLASISVHNEAPLAVLVGRVSEVSNNLAVVTTVRSSQCQISATISSSGATGTTTGTDKDKFFSKISRLPNNSVYNKNARVETSGYSEYIPAGILIGFLVPFDDGRIARPEQGGLYVETRFASAVQFDTLRFVTVLVR